MARAAPEPNCRKRFSLRCSAPAGAAEAIRRSAFGARGSPSRDLRPRFRRAAGLRRRVASARKSLSARLDFCRPVMDKYQQATNWPGVGGKVTPFLKAEGSRVHSAAAPVREVVSRLPSAHPPRDSRTTADSPGLSSPAEDRRPTADPACEAGRAIARRRPPKTARSSASPFCLLTWADLPYEPACPTGTDQGAPGDATLHQ